MALTLGATNAPRPASLDAGEQLRSPEAGADNIADACQRVEEMQRLAPPLLQRIATEGLASVYRDIEKPSAPVTAAMIATGVRVKRSIVQGLVNEHGARMQSACRRLRRQFGRRFNPDHATAVQVLTALPDNDSATLNLERYRQSAAAFHSARGVLATLGYGSRVRPDLDPLGAVTGRFTCKNPPLQSLHPLVRAAIVPAPGHMLVELDYSQIELRILAHLSQDRALTEAFEQGADLHRRSAAHAFGIPADAVTRAQRQVGKKLNFSIIYGQTAYGLAQEMKVSHDSAAQLLAAHADAYPGVATWIAAVHEQAVATGEVRTLYGRRRILPNITSATPRLLAEAKRHAVNTIIQGTGADLLKLALIRLHDALPTDVRILLSVHDSVLLEVPEHMVSEVTQLSRGVLESVQEGFCVPLRVDVGVGQSWAACGNGD